MRAWDKEGRLERFLLVAVLLEFLALTAIQLCAIPVHISRNYNEGWNAYFAQAAISGGVLYPSADSMLTNNYPPLSFYLVGALGRLIGDNIVAGRLIAVLALAIMAFNVSALGRWLGADRKLAVLGAGVFLLGVYAVMPEYVGIDDPQFLGYAFVTAAAIVFLRTEESHLWRGSLLSVLLMILGGLIKHSEIAVPLALCTWALFNDRRRLSRFLVCALVMGAAVAALTYWIWGGAMVDAIFFGTRMRVPHKAFLMLGRDLPFLLPYIALFIAALVMTRHRRQALFVLIYLTWSLLVGYWMLTDYGVNQNVMCDAVIALALASVLFVMAMAESQRIPSPLPDRKLAFAFAMMLLPCMGVGMFTYVTNPSLRNLGGIFDEPQWEALYRVLANSRGDTACETLALCYWARKPMEVDFYNYGQKVIAGAVYADAPEGFYDKVGRKAYDYVEIEVGEFPKSRLPMVLINELFKNYKPVRSMPGGILIMAPRQ